MYRVRASSKKPETKKSAAKPKATPQRKRDKKAAEKDSASTALDALKSMTTVVIDTGDFNLIEKYKPTDATTNPSLILAACQMPQYEKIVDEVVKDHKKKSKSATVINDICDSLAVTFGSKITKIVPGYVSTEVDARLSFDTEATLKKARKLIDMYKKLGVSKDRILIKIASTWEGIQAAKVLEKEGIHCNLTLLFNFHQAIACAQAGVTLISPFVGRILDWYKKSTGIDYKPEDEPGVHSVSKIYRYYKKFGHNTFVMGASFRNVGEILNLAGCDRLTIAPALLETLSSSPSSDCVRHLDPIKAKSECKEKYIEVTEKVFRWELNQDAMATEKLSEGIRKFSEDLEKLESIIKQKLEKL